MDDRLKDLTLVWYAGNEVVCERQLMENNTCEFIPCALIPTLKL